MSLTSYDIILNGHRGAGRAHLLGQRNRSQANTEIPSQRSQRNVKTGAATAGRTLRKKMTQERPELKSEMPAAK